METEKKGRSALNNADLEEGEATSWYWTANKVHEDNDKQRITINRRDGKCWIKLYAGK